MRFLREAAVVLILTLPCGHLRSADGGGFKEGPTQPVDLMEGVKYTAARLPLSEKSARTWITLRETMMKPLPDRTPFSKVIRSLIETTRAKDTSLRIYVEPTSLLEAEITMETPIESPFIGQDEVPLHTYLGYVLKPLGLTHRVHDGLLIISTPPCCDCPEPVEVTASEAWTWWLLHQEVSLQFPNETPLAEVLKAIHMGTAGKGPGGRGLVIHLDPAGLREAKKSADSPVTIEMEQVPVCTSLGLILKQLGLGFQVGDDDVLVVTSFVAEPDMELLMDEFDVIEAYQLLRYSAFWDRQNSRPASR